MGEFPYGFEYETLMTDKDRTLRKLALTLYSEDAADRIAQKYMLASTNPNQNLDDNWTDYERRVWELISRELPESEFVRALRKINESTSFLEL